MSLGLAASSSVCLCDLDVSSVWAWLLVPVPCWQGLGCFPRQGCHVGLETWGMILLHLQMTSLPVGIESPSVLQEGDSELSLESSLVLSHWRRSR